MAINPDRVKAGDRLVDVKRTQGNAGGSRTSVFYVDVIEVGKTEHGTRFFTVSWNGNRPSRYYDRQIARLRRSEPKTRKP